MSRSLLVVYLACLAFLPALITAQSCSTTGTYAGCCPSSDKKTVTFQGKEYRVYCDTVIAPSSEGYTSTPADCANRCSSMAKCVDAYWQPPLPPARSGTCELNLLEDAAQRLAFVAMASTGPSQCDKDLEKCRTDLAARQACETCPGNLEICQRDLSAERNSCAGRVSSAIESYSSALNQCQAAAASAGLKCGVLGWSGSYYQATYHVDLAGCKARCLADSRCLSYSANVVLSKRGVGTYHACGLYEKAAKDVPLGVMSDWAIYDRNCP